MKKTVLLSALIAGSLVAGEYGYREYLIDKKTKFISFDETTTVYTGYGPAGWDVYYYCIIQGGNFTKTITTDLGTEELKAFNQSDLEPIWAMSKEERIAKYGKKDEKIDIKFTREFRDTTMADRVTGKRGIGGVFECKDPTGKKLFTAHQRNGVENIEIWIVEHNPEPIVDNVDFAVIDHSDAFSTRWKGLSTDIKKAISARYPTYESYFNDWNTGFLRKDKIQKLGGNYRIRGTFNFDYKFWLNDSMSELSEVQYFCESKNGTFMKDGQPFRAFLKEFYFNGARPTGVINSVFKGNYACVGTSEAFTMKLDEYKNDGLSSFKMDYALIKKGADETAQASQSATPQPQQAASQIPTQQIQQLQQQLMAQMGMAQPMAGHGVSQEDAMLIQKVIATKTPFGTQQGANITTALYNGMDAQGCDLVALEKQVANMPQSKRIYNYKVCNGQIIALGETGLPGLPKKSEVDKIVANVVQQCKAYGAFGSQVNDLVVSCKALDVNRCNLEINIMQNNMLIEKRVENVCK